LLFAKSGATRGRKHAQQDLLVIDARLVGRTVFARRQAGAVLENSRVSNTRNRIAILGRLGVFPMVRLSLAGRRILAYLALRGEPVIRIAAASELWPDLPEEMGRANLRRALWQLPRGWVDAIADELFLQARTDICQAQQIAARALAGESLNFEEIGMLSSDILPGWNEEWVLPPHEAFHLLRVQALEAACRTMAGTGDLALATQAGAAALAAEPLRESAAEALIHAHLAQRNRVEAMQCFRSLEKRLKMELGVAPDPALARRVESIRRS
jgi:DNA-binding SARP family transcriptional activator